MNTIYVTLRSDEYDCFEALKAVSGWFPDAAFIESVLSDHDHVFRVHLIRTLRVAVG